MTPGDKARIEAEEKYRAEIKAKQDAKGALLTAKGCGGCLVLVIGLALALTFCRGPEKGVRAVNRQQFGESWPLKVDSGKLRCAASAVTFEDDAGNLYAVNGTAMTRKMGADIDGIWDSPSPEFFTDSKTGERINMAAPKKNIGVLIEAAQKICAEDGR